MARTTPIGLSTAKLCVFIRVSSFGILSLRLTASIQGNADDSDDEEEEKDHLHVVEARLLEHDPLFTVDHTAERQALRKHQLLNAYVRGLAPDDPLDTYDPESLEHNSQIHLNVERIKAPEVLWQPQMGGADQAGLAEIIEHVLKGFGNAERDRLTKVRALRTRLESGLQPLISASPHRP